MKNDNRYTEDMILRALLDVPWMLANSLELIERREPVKHYCILPIQFL